MNPGQSRLTTAAIFSVRPSDTPRSISAQRQTRSDGCLSTMDPPKVGPSEQRETNCGPGKWYSSLKGS